MMPWVRTSSWGGGCNMLVYDQVNSLKSAPRSPTVKERGSAFLKIDHPTPFQVIWTQLRGPMILLTLK